MRAHTLQCQAGKLESNPVECVISCPALPCPPIDHSLQANSLTFPEMPMVGLDRTLLQKGRIVELIQL